MADNRNAGIQKFCLDFAETGVCQSVQCTRWHKHKRHFQIIDIKYDERYILGRLLKIPFCRYFQNGSCPHGINCRYLHQLEPGHNNHLISSTNIPSTSVQNTVNRELLNETENACALSLLQQAQTNCGRDEKKTLRVNAPEFVPITPQKPSASGNSDDSCDENNMNNNNSKIEKQKCGICFETVLDKVDGESRFGILPNCNHCYCLACIRKWRQSRQFENQRSCPECRVKSDFVCPSSVWVETIDAKQKLIDNYKTALSAKDCKYFSKGLGTCPFGNKCFYRHAFPDGSTCDVGPPRRNRRRVREQLNASTGDLVQTVILWDLIDDDPDDEIRWPGFNDDINQLVDFFSDSDSSWSGYEIFFD